ncbi:hypothetical protein [Priestia megaterium]|uniref:hypothetical protein n=1 Tax=Priestia megaterium TaxID=1404 RepID=UPI002866E7E1|nr:hypothetical protein [Priestia megaterium]MDR7246841.1 hypothetical protein [Priestia megaterium]
MSDNFKCIANVADVCEKEYPKPSTGQCIPPLYEVNLEGGKKGYEIIKEIAKNYNIKKNQEGHICGSCLRKLGVNPQYSEFYNQDVEEAVEGGIKKWNRKRLLDIVESQKKDK